MRIPTQKIGITRGQRPASVGTSNGAGIEPSSCRSGPMSTFTNYVASCTFGCSGDYSVTTSGSGTSPAAARTASENAAVLQGCTITSYGTCTITP